MAVEFGIDTFGDVTVDHTGARTPHAQVLRDVVEEGVLADRVGLDFFGLGEHHRADFAVSSPEVVLAAIAARTSRIRLGSAVTVLSSDDPVRVFQRFSELDGISSGRAEVIIGRGSFTESFPLFGLDLQDYERLFEERIDLFAELLKEDAVTWRGETRAALSEQRVYPTSHSGAIRTWVGVGGSPESVVRAARYRLPLMLAIIGGAHARFAPYVDLYHRATAQFSEQGGLGARELPVGVHSPGHIAETDALARDRYFEHYSGMVATIGRERGWPPLTREAFEHDVDEGALVVGSPETVAQKIAGIVRALGLSRFDLKYSAGTLPHPALLETIELYGTAVVPRVRELLAED